MSRDNWDSEGAEEIGLLAFGSWQVDPAGYRLDKLKPSKLWSDAVSRAGAPVIEAKSGRLQDYRLGPRWAVHREFIETKDDPADILKFVDAYGLPGGGVTAMLDHILAAKQQLAKIAAIVDRASKARHSGGVDRSLAVEQLWSEVGRPKLQMQLASLPSSDGNATVVLRAMPNTLLDYMHLQFAEELQGRAAWRRCSVCGRWMAIGAGGGRRDKETCTDACRKRKQRKATEK